jgi:uncharacterized protein (DUF3084 family)
MSDDLAIQLREANAATLRAGQRLAEMVNERDALRVRLGNMHEVTGNLCNERDALRAELAELQARHRKYVDQTIADNTARSGGLQMPVTITGFEPEQVREIIKERDALRAELDAAERREKIASTLRAQLGRAEQERDALRATVDRDGLVALTERFNNLEKDRHKTALERDALRAENERLEALWRHAGPQP